MANAADDVILRLENITKIYPGTVALKDVSVTIRRGEVHGIIGRNGAGKSTLVGIISGLQRPSAGRIRLKGETYPFLTPASAAKAGVAIVPQEPEVVGECTVAENMFMPHYMTTAGGAIIHWHRMAERAQAIVDRARIPVDVRLKMNDLAIGRQQLMLILKACYVTGADVIILDEASASLPEKDKRLLYDIIRAKRDEGCAILYISHSLDELLEVCDRMTVLRDGRTVATVARRDVDKDRLAALIVGEPERAREAARSPRLPARPGADGDDAQGDEAQDDEAHAKEREGQAAAWAAQRAGRDGQSEGHENRGEWLSVQGLTRRGLFHDITFSVARGEIVGLAGLLGSGRTEILKAIAGIDPAEEGRVYLAGNDVTSSHPAAALERGIVYLPEDRDEEGLITALSVRKNMSLSALGRIVRGWFLQPAKEYDLAETMTRRLDIKLAAYDQEVRQLSGGNRQKVVFGKIVATEPKVYLLDEPTKGIDIAARRGLLDLVRDELAPTAAVVMSAPDLDDLIDVCDRIFVLWRGRIVATYEREQFDDEVLYRAVQGA